MPTSCKYGLPSDPFGICVTICSYSFTSGKDMKQDLKEFANRAYQGAPPVELRGLASRVRDEFVDEDALVRDD